MSENKSNRPRKICTLLFQLYFVVFCSLSFDRALHYLFYDVTNDLNESTYFMMTRTTHINRHIL